MLEVYKMSAGSRKLDRCSDIESNTWINLEAPSEAELNRVSEAISIPNDTLRMALDPEERAHIDIDKGCTLLVLDIITAAKGKDEQIEYTTIPMAVISQSGYIVTVTSEANRVVAEFISGRVKNFDTNKVSRFVYQLMLINAIKYQAALRNIERTSTLIQLQLHKSMKNKELIQLLGLEKALVYISTSLNSNQRVLDKLAERKTIQHYDEDTDLLEDVMIENKQAIEMATIYRDILSGTMDAFASVISNNQNIVMKFLTAVTILLTIPTLIASLWGMNVSVPFENTTWGFFVIVGIILCVLIPVLIWMIRKKMF